MNNYISKASFIEGEIKIPSSKSIAQRAIAASVLSQGKSILRNICFSDDVKTALNLAESLGAKISINNTTVEITGDFNMKENRLFVGEAGLSSRMFIPIAALTGNSFTVEGKGSILKRPMNFLVEPLQKLGLNIETNKGFLPLKISGKLRSKDISLDASESSQLLTGILMALPLTYRPTQITVSNLKSKPYIDLSLELMSNFGIKVENIDYKKFYIPKQEYSASNILLEGDWSAAAFWFVAGAINGDLKIFNLKPESKQADKAILEVLKIAGVDFSFQSQYYSVKKSNILPFYFDATDSPDLFPALAVLATKAKGTSSIKGVSRLIHKESNRAEAIVNEFRNLGIKTEIIDDKLIIHGKNKIKGGIFNSYNDHRMAMAAAILSLSAEDQIEITNYKCVSKSYPAFFDDFEKLNNLSKQE